MKWVPLLALIMLWRLALADAQRPLQACGAPALAYADTVTLGVGVQVFVGKSDSYASTVTQLFAQHLQASVSLPVSAAGLLAPYTYAGNRDSLQEYGGAFGGLEIVVGKDSLVRSLRWLQAPADSATADSILAGVTATMHSPDGVQLARTVAGKKDATVWLEFGLVLPGQPRLAFAQVTGGMQHLDRPASSERIAAPSTGNSGAGRADMTLLVDDRGNVDDALIVSHHLSTRDLRRGAAYNHFQPAQVGSCKVVARALFKISAPGGE
jgi:hypothetical protein